MEMLKIMDINRETIISEILTNFPEAMPKFQELGMHCLGCALATAESLEQACAAHGVHPELIASFASQGRGVADIGTDHAILPIILRRNGYSGYIVAGDINEGPLKKAERGLLEAEVDDVELKLCNGLEGIDGSRVDTIVVAGMGGDTITGILDRSLYDMPEWAGRSDYKLILHPVTKPEILRYWLVNNGFRITRETYVEDTAYCIR